MWPLNSFTMVSCPWPSPHKILATPLAPKHCGLLGCPCILGLSINLWHFQTWKFHRLQCKQISGDSQAFRSTQWSNIKAYFHIIIKTYFQLCVALRGEKIETLSASLYLSPRNAHATQRATVMESDDFLLHYGKLGVQSGAKTGGAIVPPAPP